MDGLTAGGSLMHLGKIALPSTGGITNLVKIHRCLDDGMDYN